MLYEAGLSDVRNLLQTLDTYMPPKHDPLEIAAPSSESIQGPNISQLLEVFPKLLNLADQSLTEAETAIQQDQSNLDSDIDAVLGKIQEIVKASEGDEYIYRGEREHYDKICSSLYRHYERDIDAENFEIQIAQAEMVKEAMDYTQERHKFAVLTELQHYGGKTNLIDFTTDYLIALFFACDGSHDDDGRVLLLKHTEENKSKYSIVRPQHPQNRVIAQKSIFVQPPEGFIVPNKVIKIPRSLKKPILDYLGKHHDISTETIYNDLHGFIRHQGLHESAYTAFFKGLTCANNDNFPIAIRYYSEALRQNSQLPEVYINRGAAFGETGRHDSAIEDFCAAIQLDGNSAEAYHNRGMGYRHTGDYCRGINDHVKSLQLRPGWSFAHYNLGLVLFHVKDLGARQVTHDNSQGQRREHCSSVS